MFWLFSFYTQAKLLSASAGGGKLSLEPSASAKFFCIAAPGL